MKNKQTSDEQLIEAVAREMYMGTLLSSYQQTWSLLPDCPIKRAMYVRAKIAVQVMQDYNDNVARELVDVLRSAGELAKKDPKGSFRNIVNGMVASIEHELDI